MYDEELEKAMLYYLIFEQEDYLLDENDFVNARNQKIIRAINELKAEKKDISILSIKSKIRANQEQVLEYISSLGDYVSLTNADSVYNDLIELSKKRKLFKLLQEKTMEIADCDSVDILAQDIIKQVNQVEQVNEKERTFLQQVSDALGKMEEESQKGVDYSLYTGLQDLDNKICGLHKQELTIIGARPRNRKDNACIANSRIYSSKRHRNSNNKLRNVRHSDNSKDAF